MQRIYSREALALELGNDGLYPHLGALLTDDSNGELFVGREEWRLSRFDIGDDRAEANLPLPALSRIPLLIWILFLSRAQPADLVKLGVGRGQQLLERGGAVKPADCSGGHAPATRMGTSWRQPGSLRKESYNAIN